MAILLLREAILVLLAGLFARYGVPAILGVEPASGLFWAGLLTAMVFMVVYAIGLLGGSKMPSRVRRALGLLAWAGAFAGLGAATGGAGLGSSGFLAPALLGPLLALLAAVRAEAGSRADEALATLFVYSLPMCVGRWLLMPAQAANPVAAALIWLTGGFYVTGRVLLRLFWPGAVEGDPTAPPLLHRPVPDAVAGLVEATSRRRARPYYTGPDGRPCMDGISVLAEPGEAAALADKLVAALGEKPFDVAVGEPVEGRLEIVVRPHTESVLE